jgi:general secretion pathway protein I
MMQPPKLPDRSRNTEATGHAQSINPGLRDILKDRGTGAPGRRAATGRLPVPRSVFPVIPAGNPCSRPGRNSSRQRGFTLIEVLIALAVLTICMSALIQAGGTRADHVGYLRDRTLAHWIATDRVTGFRLAEDWPATGTQQGETEMAGRTWSWQAEISETPEPAVRRVEVAVGVGEDGEPLSRVVGFLGDPEDRVR